MEKKDYNIEETIIHALKLLEGLKKKLHVVLKAYKDGKYNTNRVSKE